MLQRPEQEDIVGGLVQSTTTKEVILNLMGGNLQMFSMISSWFNIADINEDGDMVKRGSMWVPINAVNHSFGE
jgi:Zn-dependent alcohol dehydrogenase